MTFFEGSTGAHGLVGVAGLPGANGLTGFTGGTGFTGATGEQTLNFSEIKCVQPLLRSD